MPKSEIEIEVSLASDFLVSGRKEAVKMFRASLELDGFRKGHVPENIVLERVGEAKILEESADVLLKEHLPKIVEQIRNSKEDEKLDIIGQPKISVTKLALGNPMEFKAIFAVIPNFDLPNYKKIATDSIKSMPDKKEEADDKEVEDVLLQIRKNKAYFDWSQTHKKQDSALVDGQIYNHPDLDKEENLPKLDDDLAKAAGNFKNLDEFREKIRQNITTEKKIKDIDKKRAKIMEELTKNTKIDLPEILVESEIQKSLAQIKNNVEKAGMKWDEYLSQNKKTDSSTDMSEKDSTISENDLRKDLRESSEKKAKIQLIFNKIAEAEKLEPNKEILENEVKEILKHYPKASEVSARIYVTTILLNSEVLKLLENS